MSSFSLSAVINFTLKLAITRRDQATIGCESLKTARKLIV